jgi:hypothetical protein
VGTMLQAAGNKTPAVLCSTVLCKNSILHPRTESAREDGRGARSIYPELECDDILTTGGHEAQR